MNMLIKLDNGLMNAAEGLGRIIRLLKQRSLKQWWQAIELKRQQSYITELRNDICFNKRYLAHLQSVHAEENRKLFKMQNKVQL